MTKLSVFPTIGKVIKDTFKEIYQSFSYSALTSIFSATFYIPILLIIFGTFTIISQSAKKSITASEFISILVWGMVLSAIWNALVAAPVTTAFYSLYQNKKENYPGFKTFFTILWKVYRVSFAVNGLFSLTFVLLFMNVMLGLMERTTLLIAIGILSFYLLLFVSLMSFYFAPLIHLNNGIKKTIKKAFLLVMDNTGMTISLMLLLGVLFVLTLLLPVIWFLIYGAILVYVTDLGFNAIYNRYDG